MSLQKSDEIIYAQIGLSDDGAKRTPVDFFVVRNCCLRRRVETYHCDVTAALTLDDEANFLKRPDAFSARDDRKLGHAATSTIST